MDTSLFTKITGMVVREGEQFRSPFRDDKHAGCSVRFKRGYLRFYDGADILRNGMSMYELYCIETRKRRIRDKDEFKEIIKELGIHTPRLKNYWRNPLDLQVGYGNYQEYFEDYGINKWQLAEDNVFPISWYAYNNEQGRRKIHLDEPAFVYEYPSGKKKVYRPTQTIRFLKWCTDASNDDVVTLGRGDFVIYCGSYKDARCVANAGFCAKALQSENMLPSKWEQGYYLGDCDVDGKIIANRNCSRTGWVNLEIPKMYGVKDIADVAKHYGTLEVKKLIDSLV